jgi:curved DNA-binding protein CbpA
MPRDHYDLLGVPPTASQQELDAALERRMKQFRVLTNKGRHPDPKVLNRLREAHELLSDPSRRAAYDRRVFGTAMSDTAPPGRHRRRVVWHGGRRIAIAAAIAVLLVAALLAAAYWTGAL